jgi:hypothetical protein
MANMLIQEASMMAGVQGYIDQFPVIPTQLFVPMFWYAGSSLSFPLALANYSVPFVLLQMYEGSRYDNATAKVTSEQVHRNRDAQSRHLLANIRERRSKGGYNQHDEDCRYASWKMTVVFIFAKLEVTYYVSSAGSSEVDIRRIKGHNGLRVRCERGSRVCTRDVCLEVF